MAIQAQFYHTNGESYPFSDNGFYASGLTDSCFNHQQIHHQQQQQQLQQLQQRLQQPCNETHNNLVDQNLIFHDSIPLNPPTSLFQFEDIHQYIRLQNEKLRFMVQEQGKQQISALLNRVESDSFKLLKQKDEEIAKATRKKVELEDFIKRLEAENEGWQKMVQENEAMTLSLYKTLEEMKEKEKASYNTNMIMADDAESWCNEMRREKEEGIVGENNRIGVEMEHITREMMVCKSCNSGRSCFLFLPCRHLCSCKVCDALLKACPVCTMPKKASIETLI
ncbi:hypothetical protein Lal_00019870 [Lupinus albus]|uniref:Putative transcription factor C2H2 family n=1 Tax=Lupinus albus TaxID=3870 RepID=A0A6A4R4L8_LUPAL|nr:putative transcription factor C2H2 family [Lupinus albus]KAF1899739.1 hypothetical protein Lal_00019870 [Lupinus albus]